jgi:4-hydroxybenzoate polyprenyltransferase
MIRGLLTGVRPREWVKNLFVFAAIVFSGNLNSGPAILHSIAAFGALCLAAGATYLLNDVRDREADRNHPQKRLRPIAAGVVPVPLALVVGAASALVAIAIAFSVNFSTGLAVVGYLVLTTLYSLVLKQMVILDVVAVASGFVLRVIVGSVAIDVQFSSWLVLCTFMLALFLGFGKRRNELVLLEGNAHSHRPILSDYSPQFLDMMMAVVTAAAVMSYVLYTMDAETIAHFGSRNLIYSSVFVVYGIFRYLYLIHQRSSGGNPADVLYRDRPLLIAVAFWVASVVLLRYF